MLGQLRQSLADLAAVTEAAAAAEQKTPARAAGARRGGRSSAAAHQTLERLPEASELAAGDARARALLLAASEDSAWAWRMAAADDASPGVIAALGVLHEHASRCVDEAATLLVALSGEPVDGA